MRRAYFLYFFLGVAWALSFMLTTHMALAQTTVGTIKGTVKDATQAVVPGAQVALTSVETNISRQAETSIDGLYNFPNVPPGKYTLTVQKAGFKKWSGKLELQIQQVAVLDPTLEVGEVTATIEVGEATPTIAAESSSVGTVTDFRRIQQLPLDGRDVLNLLQLTPGVEGGGAPRVNGVKAGGAEFLQDGASIIDRFGGGAP